MAVTCSYKAVVDCDETLDTADNPAATTAAGRTVRHTGYSTQETLTADTGVPVSKCAYFEKALVAGAATIDLTALTGTNGKAVNLTGLKVQFLKVKAKATNANPITVSKGASNGYGLNGAGASWSVTLDPGMEVLVKGNDKPPDVGGSAKTIDLAGTGTQGVEVAAVAG